MGARGCTSWRRLSPILVLWVALALLPVSAQGNENRRPAQVIAVVVCVTDYSSGPLPDSVRSATLEFVKYIKRVHPGAQVFLLMSTPGGAEDNEAAREELSELSSKVAPIRIDFATPVTVETAVEESLRPAPAHSHLIFYFAGHGLRARPPAQELMLLLGGADVRQPHGKNFKITQLLRAFEENPACSGMFILDCCHSGVRWSNLDHIPRHWDRRGFMLSACSAERETLAAKFTTALLQILSAADGKRYRPTELEAKLRSVFKKDRVRILPTLWFGHSGGLQIASLGERAVVLVLTFDNEWDLDFTLSIGSEELPPEEFTADVVGRTLFVMRRVPADSLSKIAVEVQGKVGDKLNPRKEYSVGSIGLRDDVKVITIAKRDFGHTGTHTGKEMGLLNAAGWLRRRGVDGSALAGLYWKAGESCYEHGELGRARALTHAAASAFPAHPLYRLAVADKPAPSDLAQVPTDERGVEIVRQLQAVGQHGRALEVAEHLMSEHVEAHPLARQYSLYLAALSALELPRVDKGLSSLTGRMSDLGLNRAQRLWLNRTIAMRSAESLHSPDNRLVSPMLVPGPYSFRQVGRIAGYSQIASRLSTSREEKTLVVELVARLESRMRDSRDPVEAAMTVYRNGIWAFDRPTLWDRAVDISIAERLRNKEIDPKDARDIRDKIAEHKLRLEFN